ARLAAARRVAPATRCVRRAFVELSPVWGVGKPVATVGVRDDVIRRVEPFAVVRVRDDRHRAIVLVPDHAPHEVLTGELTALEVERVPIAVIGWTPADSPAAVVFEAAQLAIFRGCAPQRQ